MNIFKTYKFTLILSFLFLIFQCKAQTTWAKKINIFGLHNLYKVDESVYRSEQPNHKEMKLLDSMGIKTLVNLRQRKTDNHKIKQTGLILVDVPMNAWTISYKDVINGLQAIINVKKPVLVHCKHGSDRTGCIVAIYRIINSGWTREEAIKEFREGGFGYHEKSYPNILRLLETIDIEQVKKDLKN